MKNFTFKKYFALLITFLGVIGFGYGQIITFDFGGNIGDEVSVVSNFNDVNLGASTITRGAGLTANNNANRFNAQNWALVNIANAVSGDNYMEFTITPNAGFEFNVTTININFQRSSTGVRGLSLRSSVDSYATDIDGEKSVADNTSTQTFSFNVAQSNNTTTVTYRFYGWAEATGGSGGFEGGGNDIVVNGSVIASCLSSTTWTGTWSNGLPNSLTKSVVISSNYNTSTADIIACSLTIDSGARLTVENGDFVEVENDVTVDGQLYVDPQGNFVQNNDGALFTDNSTNGVRVRKSKTMQNWYSYTYWSSPVSGETIESTFGVTPSDRRFRFEAVNFIDLQTEIGNSNTFVAGPDDIDDDGNDWVYFTSGTMIPGVGYATTGAEIVGPGGYPNTESYDFFGPLNNGIITVSLIDNSGGAYNDWNLIGNPYACAIDVDQFFTVNSGVVDAIYLWDQATPPNSNSGGSQNNNFSVDDYAIINAGTGEIGARGDTGIVPTRHIPSGQGFFVEALAAGNVVFNNSMRITGNNTQFFRNSNVKNSNSNFDANKLWINLSSDNGISNQILIGYVNGASSNDDGTYYDTPRNLSTNVAAILYSVVENSSKKFAIQGKAPSDLNENEIINLGFKTAIDVATLYTLSIGQFQGDFLNNNPVFLIDNLLNKTHDLRVCDYNFTSEVGEFNSRFQIAFSDKALSTNDFGLNDNALKIIELDNDRVNFKLSDNLKIKSVTIFDLLGRPLYSLKGANSSETYQLSNLKNTVYIAKVELSNGTIITKKAIKQ